MQKLTVTSKGQVTLRQSLLRHLGVAPGDQIEVATLPDGQLAMRAAQGGDWSGFFGCLHVPTAPPLSIETMNEAIADGWAGKP